LEVNNGIKTEFWIFFFCSGGILLLLRPAFILLLIPLLLQKLYHGDAGRWGINAADTALIGMIVLIGIHQLVKSNSFFLQHVGIIFPVLLILNLGLTFRMMDKATYHVKRDNIRIYHPMHYTPVTNPAEFLEIKSKIPEDASISCPKHILPHLAWRDHVYSYPIHIEKAEYILIDSNVINENPLVSEEKRSNIEFHKVFQMKSLYLLKRD
jgi:hypothetical protein